MTELITVLRGASPLDIVMYLIVLFIAGRMGWIEVRKKKNPRIERHIMSCREIEELEKQKQEIKFRTSTREQMRIVEATLEAIKRDLRDRFFKELERVGIKSIDVSFSLDWRYYCVTVEILGTRLHSDIRVMIKDNGLPSKTEEQLAIYIDDKLDTLKETIRVVFDVYYGSDLLLDKSDLHEIHTELQTTVRRRFERLIRECKHIALLFEAQVLQLESKIEDIKSCPCE